MILPEQECNQNQWNAWSILPNVFQKPKNLNDYIYCMYIEKDIHISTYLPISLIIFFPAKKLVSTGTNRQAEKIFQIKTWNVFCRANYSKLGIACISHRGPYCTDILDSTDIYVHFESKLGIVDSQWEPHLFLVKFAVPFCFKPKHKLYERDCFK